MPTVRIPAPWRLPPVPTYKPALDALDALLQTKYVASDSLRDTMDEIRRRLMRLAQDAAELLRMNDAFIKNRGFRFSHDPQTNTLSIGIPGSSQVVQLHIRPADPDVPTQIIGEPSQVSSYIAGERETQEQHDQNLAFESKLEGYYNNAQVVIDRVETLPGIRKVRAGCLGVVLVRNKLVSHLAHTGGKYTFGFGSAGPLVRPMQEGEWVDAGLMQNTNEFVKALTEAFERQLAKFELRR